MNITLNIPDAAAADIVDGICNATGWTVESGKTKPQWAKEKVALWIKETAKRGLLRKSQTTIGGAIDPVAIT
ncbi:MAG: hypothetical protein EPO07_02905 [Verrucomicrobia bacterium]|nr:MAG: hypothetical protein EPO07_02905 [Verrucomicrobiota bacterium]